MLSNSIIITALHEYCKFAQLAVANSSPCDLNTRNEAWHYSPKPHASFNNG